MSGSDQSPPAITLRPLELTDAPALQGVYQACAAYFTHIWGAALQPAQAEHDLEEARSQEGRFLLGIYLEHDLIGVVDLRFGDPEPQDMRLGLLLLTPARRRHGLGRWALRILEAWLFQETPVTRVVVAVPANDHAAHAFFLANGYTFTGQSTRVLVGSSRPRLLEMHKNIG